MLEVSQLPSSISSNLILFSVHNSQLLKFESSAFAFVCLEISTLLKLENSCMLLFSEGLKFQALEELK